ncbi:MAG: aconitate hydratase AcnA [Myxococcales bacterium]
MSDTFSSRSNLEVAGKTFSYYALGALHGRFPSAARLPYSLKILLENLLRTEDGVAVRSSDIEALATLDPRATPTREIAFTPARVLLQDFTGVPAVVDLAAMRDAMRRMGGDPKRINPLQPVELVIDHSVQVDDFGSSLSLGKNADLEYARNGERYQFLKWGQRAFDNFKVVPPDTGIVHQVNLEFLVRVVMLKDGVLDPDTVVGTDSHTTMINGLGVRGWGVGGIEAEAAMLGQPVSMLIPQVLGVRLVGHLREGTTATDLVLTVTELLRKRGVVGKFVEFFGPGLSELPLADRATLANMAPEYGATCGIFPVDAETLRFLRFTGRSDADVARIEAYCKAQGLFYTPETPEATYLDVVSVDLGAVEASLAGPARPQDRVALGQVKSGFATALSALQAKSPPRPKVEGKPLALFGAQSHSLDHGAVVIAAITSCTNTSNPSVLVAAGLLAKKAVERGLTTKPWVKTSLAPGSKVVTEYLAKAGLTPFLEALGFHTVGYGCTTCIGNSGPLPAAVSKAIDDGDLVACSVLSGNRNFEGRVHAEVRANYLASPPLVVAYALAGRVDLDLTCEPLGHDSHGKPVFLADLWPSRQEVAQLVESCLTPAMFTQVYGSVYEGDEHWRATVVPEGNQYAWDDRSTYVKHPPYFVDMPSVPVAVTDLRGARCLAVLGDSITTDHISPAGNIKAKGPAGEYLLANGVAAADFNSYGARRGNHEVMVRGTFANIRLRNQLVPGVEGGMTKHLPDGAVMSIFDASMKYQGAGTPLVILAGKEYGSGSSRDWAAKGPRLLGVRAVLAESYERIHRSNLVGMGILPLEFLPGQSVASLGLTGHEVFDLEGLTTVLRREGSKRASVKASGPDGVYKVIGVNVRIDTPQEVLYYEHGGILQYVLRQLLAVAT